MKALILLFLVLTSTTVLSQDISQHWEDFRNGSPSRRVRACDALARYYQSENSDSLRILGEELFLYGIEQHYYPAIEQGKQTLATWFIMNGQTADGIAMAKSLLSNMEERGDDRMISGTASTIAIGYVHQKDGKSAVYWALRAGKYAKNNPDPLVRVESLQALADSYLLLNRTDKAIETYNIFIKAIKPYKTYRSLSAAYGKLGDIYRLKGDTKKAAYYFRLSMKNASLSAATIPKAHAINNLGIVYFEEGDTAKARESFIQAMNLRIAINDPRSIGESYYNMGEYFFYVSDYPKAINWYTKSIKYSREKSITASEADGYYALANLMKETEDFKGAAENLEKYIDLQKKINLQNSSDDEEIAELQQRIIRIEAEDKAKNGDFLMTPKSSFRWEWIIMIILSIALLGSIFLKRKQPVTDPEE